MLLDVIWHPVRPLIASVSSGMVSIWSQNQVENWSAFAPDFKELDENVEYEERESEFDLEDEDKSIVSVHEEKDEEIIDLDICKIEPIQAFLVSFYLFFLFPWYWLCMPRTSSIEGSWNLKLKSSIRFPKIKIISKNIGLVRGTLLEFLTRV